MKCPKCKSASRCIRTEPGNGETRRRRECLSASCAFRWTTVESAASAERPVEMIPTKFDYARAKAASGERVPRAKADPEAVAAAIAVDRRKREMRMQRAEEHRRKRAEQDYEDDGFDRPPPKLTREQLMREISSDGFDREYNE